MPIQYILPEFESKYEKIIRGDFGQTDYYIHMSDVTDSIIQFVLHESDKGLLEYVTIMNTVEVCIKPSPGLDLMRLSRRELRLHFGSSAVETSSGFDIPKFGIDFFFEGELENETPASMGAGTQTAMDMIRNL